MFINFALPLFSTDCQSHAAAAKLAPLFSLGWGSSRASSSRRFTLTVGGDGHAGVELFSIRKVSRLGPQGRLGSCICTYTRRSMKEKTGCNNELRLDTVSSSQKNVLRMLRTSAPPSVHVHAPVAEPARTEQQW